MKSFKRHVSIFEKSALAVIWLLVVLSIAAVLFYDGGGLMLMAGSSFCALLLSYLILVPIRYDFEEDALVLVNPKPLKSKRIFYSAMICYDTVGSFLASKVDFDSTEVVITYRSNGGAFKKTVSCHPQNMQGFVAELQIYYCLEAG